LSALGIAATIAACMVFACFVWARNIQEERLHSVAPEFCDAKLHGVALIREAFSRPDTLVFLGSSELIPTVPMRGVDFFSQAPTGFSMFPVGKAGTTALSVLQKLGGAGDTLRGKKVVLSLSPSFFQNEQVDAKYFAGNSSKLQTKEFLWNTGFSEELRQAAAQNILRYPQAYEGDWMLEFTLRRLADSKRADRLMLALIWPFASFDRAVCRLQDHVEASLALLNASDDDQMVDASPLPIAKRSVVNWDELLKKAEAQSKALAARTARKPFKVIRDKGTGDSQFLSRLKNAEEWKHFELVLRLIREAGAEPLVMSMPLHVDVLEAQGVSPDARSYFGKQLRGLTQKYRVPLVYFEKHENDPVFFVDQFDHIGSKGWWYYNKVVDDFYHNRLSPGSVASL
jgi:D-alanine transfer protein